MARHSNGWIKVYRASILGDIGSNYIRQGLFDALVAFANLQTSKVEWKGKPKTLERGELVTSLQELSELGECDRKTVLRHLNYLALRETIYLERSHSGVFIKINNYEKYQGQDAEGSEVTPISFPNDSQMTTISVSHNEELKNKRIKELKNILAFDLEAVLKMYPVQVRGPGLEARFSQQIKTQADYDDLKKSIENYKAYLKTETWRSPKQTFSAYLGTKKTGFFWRDWITLDLEALKNKSKNYENERGTDHDAEVSKLWNEGA